MGNSENKDQVSVGIRDYIEEEFRRVKSDQKRQHLVLSQVLQLKHPEDYPFDFRHLGILFVCDYSLDGVFTFKDFQHFALWIHLNLPFIQMYQFKAHLQSRTVAKIIEKLHETDGEKVIIKWFLRMLIEGSQKRKFQGETYIIIDSIKTVYEIFNVQMMADIDIQTFFYLLKKSSEEMGYRIQEVMQQEQEEQYIALIVCEQFIKHFIKGTLKILKDIGYETTLP